MKKVLTLTATLFLGACANTGTTTEAPPPPEPTAATVAEAIDDARVAAAKADAVGYEWRDTQSFIKEAEALAEKGQYADAMKLARKAKKQGKLAYKQWENQQGAAQRFE